MEIYIKGKGDKVSLTNSDFVTKGGEGSIYIKNGIVYKIYHDKNKTIEESKIEELSILDHKSIVRPLNIILDKNKAVIGFTMKEIRSSIALCRLFTNDFWKRNNIAIDIIIELVSNIKNAISFIHQHSGYLQVDGNELNYLTNKKFTFPYIIDIDSIQTPTHNATAIMPSIRDYHTKGFNHLTDWFGFAIVTCQLLLGIHPFKGSHPDFKKKDLEGRMKANVSIFNKETRLPPATREFALFLPETYKTWYIELFENGVRSEPPTVIGKILMTPVKIKLTVSSDVFEITKISTEKDEILFHKKTLLHEIVKTIDGSIRINKDTYFNLFLDSEVVLTPIKEIPIFIKKKNDILVAKLIDKKLNLIMPSIETEEYMIIENHIYIKFRDKITEYYFEDRRGDKVFLAVKSTINVMPKSTTIHSNVIYQNILGKAYFTMPIPKDSGPSEWYSILVNEADGYKILDAKYLNKVLVITAHKDNAYHRFIIKVNKDKYILRKIENIDYTPINFTVLDNGVCIVIHHDDSIEVFSNNISQEKINRFEQSGIDMSMKLFNFGNTAMFSKGNKIYKFKTKGKQ